MQTGHIFAVHYVTAAEAAYSNLYGHFTRKFGDGEWLSAAPERPEPWGMELVHLYCEVDTGGTPKHGIPIGLYYVPYPTQPVALTYGFQGWTQRATWSGCIAINYGFGVHFRVGALADGDRILVGAAYKRIGALV